MFNYILKKLEKLMAEFDDFVVAQKAHNQKVSDDLDALNTDVNNLKTQIANFPAAGLTADQKAALDQLNTDSQALSDKADTAVTNAGSPPTPPSNPTA